MTSTPEQAAQNERFLFLDGCTPAELRAMLQYVGGWSPPAFQGAREMVERGRAYLRAPALSPAEAARVAEFEAAPDPCAEDATTNSFAGRGAAS